MAECGGEVALCMCNGNVDFTMREHMDGAKDRVLVRMRYLRDPFVTGTQGDCRGGYKTILTKTKCATHLQRRI